MPDDVVENQINAARIQNATLSENDFVDIVKQIRSELKLDRHIFYFSITSSVLPDTITAMYPIEKGEFYKRLLLRYGSDRRVTDYYLRLENNISSDNVFRRKVAGDLYNKLDGIRVKEVFERHNLSERDPLVVGFNNLLKGAKLYQSIIPAFRWHGPDNQFHHWFKSLITLDLGRSIIDNEHVSSKISRALWSTLLITIPALILLIVISIPLGIWLASGQGLPATVVRTMLFSLDAIPLFWLALILIILFASGVFLNVLPAYGMGAFQSGSGYTLLEKMRYLVLPIVALVFAALGYVTIQIMKAVNDEQGKLYVLAARAKGLSEKRIRWVHIFRNSLVPVITIFSEYLTAAFAGSLVVEVIFSIPGMGKLLYDSVLGRDFNVIIGVILLIGLISVSKKTHLN